MARSLVILTALVCLGTAGYAGQVWWARTVVEEYYPVFNYWTPTMSGAVVAGAPEARDIALTFWKGAPWYGERVWFYRPKRMRWTWIPRRYYREFLVLLTGQDSGGDPGAWEAWFKAHPNLVWDPKLNRLVDRPWPLLSSPA